jgi:hypothetical protein
MFNTEKKLITKIVENINSDKLCENKNKLLTLIKYIKLLLM